ncbi:MAG: deoxyguanosinetriphosphate triphosphohydrolase [Synergistaceae bacterium]|jgi:dGTPase|nr:deoxyguanosinetriphosphate triphosphohydrolase [Synergistaceae bacterium]
MDGKEFGNIREDWERHEAEWLSRYACLASMSKGREREEEPCPMRTVFQRDRDRVIHSKSFRRLKHKTQVLLLPESDHPRTRLTHTLEVAQIARTISRTLRLNEDLTEAIALAHDLGHTPFGHMGEHVLSGIARSEGLPAFRHAEQSLRVVDLLERGGKGLNLTWEVRMGIIQHSKGQVDVRKGFGLADPSTVEAWVVRVSDSIAYLNHDLDDALGAGFIKIGDVPEGILENLGPSHGKRIGTLVRDVTANSADGQIRFSNEILSHVESLRKFLFNSVYRHETIRREEPKVENILRFLYKYARDDMNLGAREALDVISGMTDRYALHLFRDIAEPRA